MTTKSFLDYYRENLTHIRELGGEFAAEFPKIAARLGLSPLECEDPYVERLLEGTAFLAARVEKKLDEGYPRLLESILSAIAPSALEPEPSGAVLELTPEYGHPLVKHGLVLEPGVRFAAKTPVSATRCVFSTALDLTILPFSVREASYQTRGLEAFSPSRPQSASVLRVDLQTEGGGSWLSAQGQPLTFYLSAPDEEASRLSRLFLSDLERVFVSADGSAWSPVDAVRLANPALDRMKGCFARASDPLGAVELLDGALAHPDFLKFIRIEGLGDALSKIPGRQASVAFLFRRRDTDFTHTVSAETMRLWCVPAVNRFLRRSERAELADRFEFRIVPSRTAPLDFEVASVESLEVFSTNNELLLTPRRFYTARIGEENGPGAAAFFSVHRRDRLTRPEGTRRSSYLPTEVLASVSGEGWQEVRDRAAEASASVWCTNADLPLFLRGGAKLVPEMIRGVSGARFLSAPSRPGEPLVAHGASADWQKTAYLLVNLSSLLWQPGGAVRMLRHLVSTFSRRPRDETDRLAESILSVETEPKVFRFIRRGCVYFENGWSVDIRLSDRRLEGVGSFVFGAILALVIRSLTPINTEVEITLSTEEEGAIARWTTQSA